MYRVVAKVCGQALCFGLALLVVGCGDKDCYVVSADAKGIQKDAPVVWQDAYVGKVSAVEAFPSCSRVSLGIKSEFAEKIHAGVSARIVQDKKISVMPFVLLIGGKDSAMPVLSDGVQIPEAVASAAASGGNGSFAGWLKESSHLGEKAGGGLIVFLLIVLRFVKKLVKMLIKLLILVVIALTLLVAKQDWSAYRARFDSAAAGFQSVQSWISDHSDTLRKIVDQALPVKEN